MKSSFGILGLLCAFRLLSAEPTRLKEMAFHLPTGALQSRAIFQYDDAGNITRIAEFDKSGQIETMQYYFYANNCLAKVLKYRKGALAERQEIAKTPDCQRIFTVEKDANGAITKYIYYTYQNGFLKSFTEHSPEHLQIAVAESTVADAKVRRVEIRYENLQITMHYDYQLSDKVQEIRVDSMAQFVIKIKYESGVVTPESARYLYE